MTNELVPSLYECQDIIKEIEAIAAANDGEIPDDKLELLVQAQTTSLAKLTSLCGFIKFVEHRIDLCKQEEARISAMRKTAENRLKSIERFLTPFVSDHRKEHGCPLNIGTFTLSTRKSKSVEIDDVKFNSEENRKLWCVKEVSYRPDKKLIKEVIESGTEIQGAKIEEHESLVLK